MSISKKNIIQGITHQFTNKKKKGRFPALGWVKEKTLKHQDDQEIKTIELGRLKIIYKRPYEVLHTYKELFEEEIYNFSSPTPSPFIIDCGANIGMSVLYFKMLYPQSKVIAYEPDNDNFSLLQQNVKINNLADVDCRQTAVWTTNGTISFASDGTQGSQITSDNSGSNTIKIKAERLADLIKENKIDFLKIDIEGAEVEVINDCSPYLKNVENLFVEYHGKANETEKLSHLLNVLKENYKVYIKMAADSLPHPFVDKSMGAAFDVQLNIFCYK